jgi:hypothetical protein
MLRPIALLAISVAPAVGFAQEIDVTLDARTRALLGARSSLAEQQIEAELEQQARSLTELDLMELLDEAANAQALVHKSLGNDYASGPDGFMLGASASAAIDPGREIFPGTGAQITLMLGYNFAGLGLPDLTIFAHGMGAPITFSRLDGSFYNFGASAQYRLIGPRGTKMLEWGGLHVTSGVEVSRMRLTVASNDMLDFDTSVAGVDISGDSEGRLTLVQHAVSVPLEVTTAVTALYFLTIYGGLGADLDFGGANLSLDVDTTVTAAGTSENASAEAVLEDAGDPDRVTFRVLGGVQANLGPVRLFAQINVRPVDLGMALAAGARVTF